MNKANAMKDKQTKSSMSKRINFFWLFWISVMLLVAFSARWAVENWGGITFEEVVYTLTAPLKGTDNDIIEKYLMRCLLPTFVLSVVIMMIDFVLKKRGRELKKKGITILVMGLCGYFIYAFCVKFKVVEYINNQSEKSVFIANEYIDPAEIDIVFPEKKRNLIYIYLESMEVTYADKKNGGWFENNFIPELVTLAQENEDFSGMAQLNGAYIHYQEQHGQWERCLLKQWGSHCRFLLVLMI